MDRRGFLGRMLGGGAAAVVVAGVPKLPEAEKPAHECAPAVCRECDGHGYIPEIAMRRGFVGARHDELLASGAVVIRHPCWKCRPEEWEQDRMRVVASLEREAYIARRANLPRTPLHPGRLPK